ncbi:MAG: DivIVA domain-containing protein, partial [Streptomycetaceae bacterium]|nr:DivIVA domain-containing protein [Streptomycetaceae bacterium]
MFWIQLVVVTAVVFVVAAVVLGAGGSLPDAYQDRPDLSWTPDKPLTVEDVDRVRFPVVLRGYRMSEVDYTLDRLSEELSARDARIMDLEYRLAGVV